MRSGTSGSDVWVAQDGGMAAGYIARGPNGCSKGLRSYGSSDALAAGGNEEVLVWELEVEGMMREMARRVEEEESDL